VGLFLGVSAVIAAFAVSRHFLWIELLIAIVIVAMSILWEVWKTKRAQR